MIGSDLAGLRAEFRRRCRRIGAEGSHGGWFRTRPTSAGDPPVEQSGEVFSFVVEERGVELRRSETKDPDDVLYWLFSAVTFDLASREEAANRRPDEDFRRQLFDVQLALLERLEPAWAERRRREIETVLGSHPYDDGRGGRGG